MVRRISDIKGLLKQYSGGNLVTSVCDFRDSIKIFVTPYIGGYIIDYIGGYIIDYIGGYKSEITG